MIEDHHVRLYKEHLELHKEAHNGFEHYLVYLLQSQGEEIRVKRQEITDLKRRVDSLEKLVFTRVNTHSVKTTSYDMLMPTMNIGKLRTYHTKYVEVEND